MSACEKCWRDSRRHENYAEVLASRKDHPCSAEEQAGIGGAGKCPVCNRMTIHMYTGEAMCGCKEGRDQCG